MGDKLVWLKNKLPILKDKLGMLSESCCCSSTWFATSIGLSYTSEKVAQSANYAFSFYNAYFSTTYNCFLQHYSLTDSEEAYWHESFDISSASANSITGLIAINDLAYFCGSYTYSGFVSTVKCYNPATATTTNLGTLTDQCVNICKDTSNNIYVACINATSGYIKKWENNSWVTKATLSNNIQYMSMSDNNIIYVTSRNSDTSFTVYKYNTSTNTLTTLNSITDSSVARISNAIVLDITRKIDDVDTTQTYAIKSNVILTGGVFTYNWNLLKLNGSTWTQFGTTQALHTGDVNCIKNYSDGRLIIAGGFVDLTNNIINIVEVNYDDENNLPIYSNIGTSSVQWFNCTGSGRHDCCSWISTTTFDYLHSGLNPSINDVFVNANNSILAGGGTQLSRGGGSAALHPFVKSSAFIYTGTHVASYPYPIVTFNNLGC